MLRHNDIFVGFTVILAEAVHHHRHQHKQGTQSMLW